MQLLILSLFAGVNIAFGFLSFLVWKYDKFKRLLFYFAIFSLFSAFYFLFIALSIYKELDMGRIVIFCAAVYYAMFPWFLHEHIGINRRWVSTGLSLIFFVAYMFFFFKINLFGLITWQHIAHLGLIGLVLISFQGFMDLKTKGNSGHKQFFVLVVIFAFLAFEEIIATYTRESFLAIYTFGIMPLDLFPLIFSSIMVKKMAKDIFLKSQLELQLLQSELKRKRLELIDLEKKVLEVQLVHQDEDLTDFGIKLTKNKDILRDTLKRLEQNLENMPHTNIELQDTINFLKSQIRIDDRIDQFNGAMGLVNHKFLYEIKRVHPTLTENELHLLSLLKLKLSTKEIASVKNISPDSVKVLRYRLRKKLNFNKEMTFAEFLNSY